MAIYTGNDSIAYAGGDPLHIPIRTKDFPVDDLLTFRDNAGNDLLILKFIQLGLSTSGIGRLEIESPVIGLTPTVNNFQQWGTEEWHYVQIKYNPNGKADFW